MISGIAIVGGNGSGKTTFGRYLAGLLGYRYMDVEDYYFRESDIPYTNMRTKQEVQALLLRDIKRYDSFVLSSVGGDFGEEINGYYTAILYMYAPLDIRLARVKQRATDKFGSRVLSGGDMYEQEQAFLQFVANRSLEKTERWAAQMGVPVLYLDGTAPVADNGRLVKTQLGL